MKLKNYLLKRLALLVKLLLFWLTMDGQIYTWGDLNQVNCNHSVVSIIEGKTNDIIILGKVADKNFKNLKIGYSRIATDGKVLSNQILEEKLSFYDINALLNQPDGMLRIYGTVILANGMLVPYLNDINPENGSKLNFASTITDLGIFGDVKLIDKTDIITLKGKKNLSTGNFAIYAQKSDIASNNMQKNYISIDSKFNEEPKSLYVLPDTSFYMLGRRDIDRDRSKSIGIMYYISPDFKIMWNMQVLNSVGLSNQCMTCGKDGWIYYFSSKKEDENTSCSTKGFIFEKDGNKIRQIEIDSCFINATLTLKNGNILVAGYKIQKSGQNTLKKAHYIVYNPTLKKIKSRTLGPADKPDAELTTTTQPVSSEYTTAIQLSNGKIVLGGNALLPVNTTPEKIASSARANKYLIAILSAEGVL
jgi:hypothetical protein